MTEPTYIKGLHRTSRNATVEVEIPDKQGVPLTLVTYALTIKREADRKARKSGDPFERFDEVWCVFDIDEHPNVNDARQLAGSNDVRLAISNPCFELWLILHLREQPGAQHRHDMQAILKHHIQDYDKHFDFDEISNGIDDATLRSKRLDEEALEEGEAGRNPTTSMYLLTDSIRAA